jgi:hypothetical protein
MRIGRQQRECRVAGRCPYVVRIGREPAARLGKHLVDALL